MVAVVRRDARAVNPQGTAPTTISSAPIGVPGVLRHLVALSGTFTHRDAQVPYLHIYARPCGRGAPTALEFIVARETGMEGIACVDDVSRAAMLALTGYEDTGNRVALNLAIGWLGFVAYMQEPDGRFVNLILDREGRKNVDGRTSHAGGQWWSSRACWTLATAWRITGDERYRYMVERARLAGVVDLKITAVQALALMELHSADPSPLLRTRIVHLCDRIVAGGRHYLRDRPDRVRLMPWGYHQLQALARAGALLGREEYLQACERTVARVVEPLISGGFAEVEPWGRAPNCAYDVSSMVLGLEALYRATSWERYRALALDCAGWLTGGNAHGVTLYDPHTGCCSDGLDGGVPNPNCGAESSIEAGLAVLACRRLASEVGRGSMRARRARAAG